MMWHAWSGTEWVLMTLMMVALWGGLVAIGAWFAMGVRDGSRPPRPTGHLDRADELLAARLARGDIDPDEYVRRRAVLRSDS